MTIRAAVLEFVNLGPLPRSDAPEREIAAHEEALARIPPPITPEEAEHLVRCFGEDECFGLAWTLLHLLESSPGPSPVTEAPGEGANEWLRRLWRRAHQQS